MPEKQRANDSLLLSTPAIMREEREESERESRERKEI